jgi:hypothetical protein
MPDRTCTATDKDSLAIDGTLAKDRVHRRQGGNAKDGTFYKGNIISQGYGLFRGQGDKLGRCAEGALPLPVPDPDPLADAVRRNTVADGLDNARAIAMRNDRRKGYGFDFD